MERKFRKDERERLFVIEHLDKSQNLRLCRKIVDAGITGNSTGEDYCGICQSFFHDESYKSGSSIFCTMGETPKDLRIYIKCSGATKCRFFAYKSEKAKQPVTTKKNTIDVKLRIAISSQIKGDDRNNLKQSVQDACVKMLLRHTSNGDNCKVCRHCYPHGDKNLGKGKCGSLALMFSDAKVIVGDISHATCNEFVK